MTQQGLAAPSSNGGGSPQGSTESEDAAQGIGTSKALEVEVQPAVVGDARRPLVLQKFSGSCVYSRVFLGTKFLPRDEKLSLGCRQIWQPQSSALAPMAPIAQDPHKTPIGANLSSSPTTTHNEPCNNEPYCSEDSLTSPPPVLDSVPSSNTCLRRRDRLEPPYFDPLKSVPRSLKWAVDHDRQAPNSPFATLNARNVPAVRKNNISGQSGKFRELGPNASRDVGRKGVSNLGPMNTLSAKRLEGDLAENASFSASARCNRRRREPRTALHCNNQKGKEGSFTVPPCGPRRLPASNMVAGQFALLHRPPVDAPRRDILEDKCKGILNGPPKEMLTAANIDLQAAQAARVDSNNVNPGPIRLVADTEAADSSIVTPDPTAGRVVDPPFISAASPAACLMAERTQMESRTSRIKDSTNGESTTRTVAFSGQLQSCRSEAVMTQRLPPTASCPGQLRSSKSSRSSRHSSPPPWDSFSAADSWLGYDSTEQQQLAGSNTVGSWATKAALPSGVPSCSYEPLIGSHLPAADFVLPRQGDPQPCMPLYSMVSKAKTDSQPRNLWYGNRGPLDTPICPSSERVLIPGRQLQLSSFFPSGLETPSIDLSPVGTVRMHPNCWLDTNGQTQSCWRHPSAARAAVGALLESTEDARTSTTYPAQVWPVAAACGNDATRSLSARPVDTATAASWRHDYYMLQHRLRVFQIYNLLLQTSLTREQARRLDAERIAQSEQLMRQATACRTIVISNASDAESSGVQSSAAACNANSSSTVVAVQCSATTPLIAGFLKIAGSRSAQLAAIGSMFVLLLITQHRIQRNWHFFSMRTRARVSPLIGVSSMISSVFDALLMPWAATYREQTTQSRSWGRLGSGGTPGDSLRLLFSSFIPGVLRFW